MTTTTNPATPVCQAEHLASFLRQEAEAGRRMIAMPTPSAVSHADYQVGYCVDGSAVIWSRHDGYFAVPAVDPGWHKELEHAARCMGHYSREQRAAMVGPADRWIDGVLWGSDGRFIAI